MKILLIDDDPDLVELVTLAITMKWPDSKIVSAPDGDIGIEMTDTETPDLVILDAGLPDMDGFSVCQEIRHFSDVPVMILSDQDKKSDIVHGLQIGADDYIIKPVRPLEFMARVASVLRRADSSACSGDKKFFRYGDLTVDFAGGEVCLGDQRVNLAPIEFQLLYHLVRNAGKFLSHRTLLGLIWGWKCMEKDTYLKVHIHRLRQKLGDEASNPRFIFTEPTVGYKFAKIDQ